MVKDCNKKFNNELYICIFLIEQFTCVIKKYPVLNKTCLSQRNEAMNKLSQILEKQHCLPKTQFEKEIFYKLPNLHIFKFKFHNIQLIILICIDSLKNILNCFYLLGRCSGPFWICKQINFKRHICMYLFCFFLHK